MRKILILGAGTAGTIVANKLRHVLPDDAWSITVVDPDKTHYYQPGFLFLPFGLYEVGDVMRARQPSLERGVEWIVDSVDVVEPEHSRVVLAESGQALDYDYLIIATGTYPRPEETPGLTGRAWRRTIHDFYTFEGALALRETLADWPGGRLVVNIMEMPIKCPVAPLEFLFLADDFFRQRGIREQVTLTLVTPLPGAFTKPEATKRLSTMLAERNIAVVPDFYPERVDPERRRLIAYDETEVGYDLLVTVPVNMGAEYVARSGLGDELNHVPVDRHTFRSDDHPNIFALGDAAALPTSKAGSVAHFSADVFVENFVRLARGENMTAEFDGHANCFIESGDGKGLLIDFNYEVEPLPGKYPIPGIGPFDLLKETRRNHWGKLGFRWLYWNALLPGRPLPVPTHMSMAGKVTTPATED